VSRGTKLYQAPGSPLIQGRSRLERPWWQPFAIAVAIGIVWPVITMLPLEIADTERTRLGATFLEILRIWASGLLILVPSVLVGAAIGVTLAGMWGMRHRWLGGAVAAIGLWYAVLVVVGLVSG